MGSCCAGRTPPNKNANPYYSNFEQSPDSRLFSYKISHFYSKNNVFSRRTDFSNFNSEISGEEMKTLKLAKKSKDLETIISMINSKTPITEDIEINHIWATKPKSIGALACLYATMFFLKNDEMNLEDELEEESLMERYSSILIKGDIGKRIKSNLNSPELDIWDLSIILLGFLTDENKIMQNYFAEKGFHNVLIKYLSPFAVETRGIMGIRVAVLQIVRDVCKGRRDLIKRVIESKGFEMVFDILDTDDLSAICEVLQSIDELSIDNEKPEKRLEFVMEELDQLDIFSKLQEIINRIHNLEGNIDLEQKDAVEKYAIFVYNVCSDYVYN